MTGPDARKIDRDLETLKRDGYVIVDRLIGPGGLAALRSRVAPYLTHHLGRNVFEGKKTERVYTLVGKGRVFADLVEHPHILALCDRLLQPGYLLTASQAIHIHPGETAQPLHTDDSAYPLRRPRPPVSIGTIWAIDDFTAENGATVVVPGSHQWGKEQPAGALDRDDFQPERETAVGRNTRSGGEIRRDVRPVQALMPAGSVMVFAGTLWHGGGANTSDSPRLAISNQYCEPWARQQENFAFGIPPQQARAMTPRVQELVGYSMYSPLMGHAGGQHPQSLIDPG